VETPAGERGDAEDKDEEGKSDDYSVAMQARMGGSLTYRHEDGINFAYVLPDVIVGSCPQGAADVDKSVAPNNRSALVCITWAWLPVFEPIDLLFHAGWWKRVLQRSFACRRITTPSTSALRSMRLR
jgi:hypothetical protein